MVLGIKLGPLAHKPCMLEHCAISPDQTKLFLFAYLKLTPKRVPLLVQLNVLGINIRFNFVT